MSESIKVDDCVIDNIKELAVVDKVELTDKLNDDLGLDSLDRVELAINIERALNITLHDDKVEQWDNCTVKEAIGHVQEAVDTQKK